MKAVENELTIGKIENPYLDLNEERETFMKYSTKAAQLVVGALIRTIQLTAIDKTTNNSLKVQRQQQRQVEACEMNVQLRRLGPHNQITVLSLSNGDCTWTTGRGSNSDIYILSRYVSRTHFSIKYRNKNFYVYDHGSVNGTYINDKRINAQQEYPLPVDSVISIGVTSCYQNDPDCIVFAFEACKKRELVSKEIKVEKKCGNIETVMEDVEMKSSPGETNLDRKKIVPDGNSAKGGQLSEVPNSGKELSSDVESSSAQNKFNGKRKQIDVIPVMSGQLCKYSSSAKEIDVDTDKTKDRQKTSDGQCNNVTIVKPEPVCTISVTDELIMNKMEIIAANEVKHNISNSFDEASNTATSAEIDLFEPEVYADDEIDHAFEAQTQVDEPSTRNTQLSYSLAENYIEISDSEDDLIGNIKTEAAKVSFTKMELEDDDYGDEIVCLDVIKSENKENCLPSEEIKILDDDDFTETDIKWMGKLFKTKEECCSFIQSQREDVESAESGESESAWVNLVTSCAEELQEILVTNDTEEDELLKASEDVQNVAETPESRDFPPDLLNNDNSVVVGLLTLSQENRAPTVSESPATTKKRSPSPAKESSAEEKTKKIKLYDPFEFENEADILKPFGRRKKVHSSSATSSDYNITPLTYVQSKCRKFDIVNTVVKDPKVSKPFKQKSRRGITKTNNLPAAEKIKIRDQRRKKLRELCSSRVVPNERKRFGEPRVDAPLKVKITKKNRNEYLCEQIGNEKLTQSNSKIPAKLAEGSEASRALDEEKADVCPKQLVEEWFGQTETDYLRQVPQICEKEKEGKEVFKEKILSKTSTSCELEYYTNVNVIVVQNERRDLKSCLKKYGYAFMRSNRPMVPLKSVRFATTRSIKFYETENNIRRKTSLLHTNNAMKLTGENRLLRQKFAFITEICKWNAAWLEECKRAPLHELPPAFRRDKLKWVQKNFPSHDNYMKTFIPLILLELLHSMIERWRNVGSGIYRFPAELKRYAEDLGALGGGLGRLHCESVLEVSTHVQFFVREGDLIMIPLRKPFLTNCEENKNGTKKLVWMIFGYVEKVVLTIAEPEKSKSFDGKSLVSKSSMVLSLEVLVAKRSELFTKSGTIVQITGAYHTTPNFNMCQAVSMLAKSPLCQTILSPNRPAMALSYSPCSEDIIFSGPLDDMQRELVLKLVSSCLSRAQGLLQFQGGPGTGKTHVIIAFILQMLYTQQWKGGPRPMILYCTHSNVAVDHTTLKLKNYRQSMSKESRYKLVRFGHPSLMKPDVRDVSTCSLGLRNDQIIVENKVKALNEKINALVADLEPSNELNEAEIEKKSSELHSYVKERETLKNSKSVCITGKKPTYESECYVIENADVICTTFGSVGAKIMLNVFEKIRAKNPKRKIICIVDEAMQSKESETIIPLLLGVTHLILVGDPRQLKAPVQCEMAQQYGLNQSLFWRIMTIFNKQPNEGSSPVFTLINQYRMNSAISSFPIRYFYRGHLRDCIKDRRSYNIQDYVVLIDSAPQESSVAECETRLHEITVKLVSEMLITMADDIPDNNFGVITSTEEHSKTLKAILSEKVEAKVLLKLDVNPIENVQGQEFDIVLAIIEPNMVSTARANVALTRARHSLIILMTNPVYKYNKFLSSLAEDACIRGVSSYVAPHMEGPMLRRLVSKTSAVLE